MDNEKDLEAGCDCGTCPGCESVNTPEAEPVETKEE